MSERRKKREFTDEFKKQVVSLYNNGKSRSEIIKEYDLTLQHLPNGLIIIIIVDHLK